MIKNIIESTNKLEEKLSRMQMENDLGFVALELVSDLMDEQIKLNFKDDKHTALFFHEADRVLPMISNTLYLALDNLSNSLKNSKEEVSRLQEKIRILEQK